MTLVKVKGHMTLVRYCGFDTGIILSHDLVDSYSYVFSATDIEKYGFLSPLTLKMH